jgi:hypothetical protein
VAARPSRWWRWGVNSTLFDKHQLDAPSEPHSGGAMGPAGGPISLGFQSNDADYHLIGILARQGANFRCVFNQNI